MANWARMIDSAQRRLSLTRVTCPNWPPIHNLVIEIQGLIVHLDDSTRTFAYADMAESGVVSRGVKPLSFWERIRRRPASIGDLAQDEGGLLVLTYWTDPELTLTFDVTVKEEAALWRECEIMALNAGFHFRSPPELRHLVQQVF